MTKTASEPTLPRTTVATDIKQVPRPPEVRLAIRQAADQIGKALDRSRPPSREQLEAAATQALHRLHLPHHYLGFAMVAVSNAFWQSQFAATPFSRRLLLLPQCLRSQQLCRGSINSLGLQCAHCGSCLIPDFLGRARDLGYDVVVAEGTTTVIMKVLEGQADAILGVACLDSLEKSFARIAELGIPYLAVPLLTDGCRGTTVEPELVLSAIGLRAAVTSERTRSYLPLLRETTHIFEPASLSELLSPYLGAQPEANSWGPQAATEAVALEWLGRGGKRLRPFVTVAAYATARHGALALSPNSDVSGLIPTPLRRLAVAIEALHKASLVHDDIEDDDALRYGQPTLHQVHGIPVAINVGDFLVGLGYRLIAGEAAALGPGCVADILGRLSAAHLELCRGQGAELSWPRQAGSKPRPLDALAIAAKKTAPAFEVALYIGLRAAGVFVDADALHRFCSYLGEAYQVQDDLDDWEAADGNESGLGNDVLAGRPTILRAFAIEAGGEAVLATLQKLSASAADPAAVVSRVRELYRELGAFEKAERLLHRLRQRALDVAAELEPPAITELLRLLVSVILRAHVRPTP